MIKLKSLVNELFNGKLPYGGWMDRNSQIHIVNDYMGHESFAIEYLRKNNINFGNDLLPSISKIYAKMYEFGCVRILFQNLPPNVLLYSYNKSIPLSHKQFKELEDTGIEYQADILFDDVYGKEYSLKENKNFKSLLSESRDNIENLRTWLNNRKSMAIGKDENEKIKWLWKNDKSYAKVANILINWNKSKRNIDAVRFEHSADRYYIRFGEIPLSGKSINHLRNVNEKGISAYRAKWNLKLNKWEVDTSQLSEIGINTIDSFIADIGYKRERPIYLLYGQELQDIGLDDGESLLIKSDIKTLKKLKLEDLYIPEIDIY